MIETRSSHEPSRLGDVLIAVQPESSCGSSVTPDHNQEYVADGPGWMRTMKAVARIWYCLALALTLITSGVGWSSLARVQHCTTSLSTLVMSGAAIVGGVDGSGFNARSQAVLNDDAEESHQHLKALEAEADGQDAPIDALPCFSSVAEVFPIVRLVDQAYGRKRELGSAHFLVSTGPPRGPPTLI